MYTGRGTWIKQKKKINRQNKIKHTKSLSQRILQQYTSTILRLPTISLTEPSAAYSYSRDFNSSC